MHCCILHTRTFTQTPRHCTHRCQPNLLVVSHSDEAGNDYLFAFGGCHRWAAAQRLGNEVIRARLVRVPPSVISTYLGASSPFAKKVAASSQEQQEQQPLDRTGGAQAGGVLSSGGGSTS